MITNISKIIKNNWQTILALILALVFFVGVVTFNSLLYSDSFMKWSSPDETANYVFTKFYGQTGEMILFEKYNLYVDDIIRPRSMRSDHGNIKPVSFLGIIIIFGKIVSLTSYKIIPYLTPFFASLGIFFFFLLIKKIFGKNNALLSSFLLASFPVWIYYSARSMFHNVLFVSLLIIGLYFAVAMTDRGKIKYRFFSMKFRFLPIIYASLAGVFVGLAIITRASELLWVAPMFFVVWIFNIKKVGIVKLLIFLAFVFLGCLPALYYNQILYSSPLSSGYAEMNASISSISSAGSGLVFDTVSGKFDRAKDFILNISDNIFYFGLQPRQSMAMFYHYFASMFSAVFILACLGGLLYLQKIYKWKKKLWVFSLSAIVFSVILIFYYGSWKFNDNPDPNSFTIGNSYTRYWLPIYLASFPLASFFLLRFTKSMVPDKFWGQSFLEKILPAHRFFALRGKRLIVFGSRIVIVVILAISSLLFVFYGSEEGLIYNFSKNDSSFKQMEKVLSLTEPSSVLVTTYHDKIFFPERKVIVGNLNDSNMNERYRRLAELLPVYYYNFTFSEADINYLNERKLKEVSMQIREIEKINSDFTLYKLEPLINNIVQ